MSEDLDELAATVAGMLASALAGDSWEDAKQWFAAVLGHEGRLAATRAELISAGDGPARDLAVQAQVSAWTVRLRDVFEDNPAAARTLQDLVAGMRAQGLLKPSAASSRQAAPAAALPPTSVPARLTAPATGSKRYRLSRPFGAGVNRRRNRVLVAVALIGVGAGLAAVLYPSGASSGPPTAQVLATLANRLTSADPRVEAEALVPGGAPVRGQPATLLPAGSKVAVEPATWETTGVDSSGAPAAGRVRARLTEPGRPAAEVYLELVKLHGRWLVYETSQA